MTQPAVEPVYGSDYGLQLEGDGVDPSDGTAGTFWLVMLLVGGSYMPVRRFTPESRHSEAPERVGLKKRTLDVCFAPKSGRNWRPQIRVE